MSRRTRPLSRGALYSWSHERRSRGKSCPFRTGSTWASYDAKDPETKYPPIEPLRPPKGAPNVLIVLIDDVGFGASSAFGRPQFSAGSIVSTYNKSHALTAEVVVPESGAEGVIFAWGGRIGGYSLYARNGRLKYCYNFCGLKHFFVESAQAIPPGKHQLRMEFAYDGGGVAKGGAVSLFIDGKKAGEGRVEMTEPFGFSADETVDVGMEAGSPVSPDYGPRGNAFSGQVNWVEIDVDKEALDMDHFLTGEERFRVAMAYQ